MRTLKVVGIVAQNRALSSILAMMLRDCQDMRVRVFETHKALQIYLRIAPIHLLLCDYQLNDMSCPQLVSSLKSNPQMHTENMQIVALTRNIDRNMQREIGITGIDEVIVKPMSPAYIRERVTARLALPAKFRRIPVRNNSLAKRVDAYIETIRPAQDTPSNVVQLFAQRQPTRHPEHV
ncbi:two-component system response regulator [Maritalea porphyrae]|uniref:response regulator n=1 Tax=Maritalea porphyrae TaxID=880732 RepID=UPI0022AEB22E|nr:response regulator [Maritalea porphyrae]MCZ4271191.1 response regulator [Maritalea porphyrae]